MWEFLDDQRIHYPSIRCLSERRCIFNIKLPSAKIKYFVGLTAIEQANGGRSYIRS